MKVRRKREYFIDEDKKVVACIQPNEILQPFEEAFRKTSTLTSAFVEIIDDYFDEFSNTNKTLHVKPQKGKATCDDRDEFDVKTGKIIARLKSDFKYHKSMINKYCIVVDILEKAICEINGMISEHAGKAIKIKEEIKEYTEGK